MMALVTAVNDLPLEQIQAPLLLIHATDDKVVSSAAATRAFARLGSTNKQRVELQHSQDSSHHVLAGRIMAPADTNRVTQLIEAFVREQAAASD